MKLTRMRALRAAAAGAVALTLAVGIAGCSGGGDSGGKTTITFYSWDNAATMKPLIQDFEKKNPDITVDASYGTPVEGYISTLQTRINSGTAADVFIITAENKTQLMQNKLTVDLSKESWTDNLADSAKENYTLDGKLYGAAVASWGGGIVYNEDILKKVGFTTPPATWDEFLDLLKKVQATGVTPILESAQQLPESLAAEVGIANENAGGKMDQEIWDGKSSFADTWTKPLELWNQLITDGYMPKTVTGLTSDQVTSEFAAGKTAMMVTGSWGLGSIKTAAPNVNFKFMAVPGQSSTYWAGAVSPGYAVNVKSQHQAAALAFVKYLTTKDAVEIYQKETGTITTTKDFSPDLDPALADMVTPVRDGHIYLPQVSWPTNSDAMNTEATALVQQMINGSLSPAQVAKGLDTKLASVKQ